MRSMRELSHVRFRCFYSAFSRWRRAARHSRVYRSRGLRLEMVRRRRLLLRYSGWLEQARLPNTTPRDL
jgi:hypothetical protein